jgi:hypothetical protein
VEEPLDPFKLCGAVRRHTEIGCKGPQRPSVLGQGSAGGAAFGRIGCSILAPHEHSSHTHPLSWSPSSSPHCLCSATNATNASSASGIVREATAPRRCDTLLFRKVRLLDLA